MNRNFLLVLTCKDAHQHIHSICFKSRHALHCFHQVQEKAAMLNNNFCSVQSSFSLPWLKKNNFSSPNSPQTPCCDRIYGFQNLGCGSGALGSDSAPKACSDAGMGRNAISF